MPNIRTSSLTPIWPVPTRCFPPSCRFGVRLSRPGHRPVCWWLREPARIRFEREGRGRPPPEEALLQLSVNQRAAAQARRVVRDTMAFQAVRDTDAASLLATELVTNAVRHAGLTDQNAIELEVGVQDRTLRISVTDEGPGFMKPAYPVGGSNGGFGLQLVDAIADRWGVNRRVGGIEVWFEIDLPKMAILRIS